MTMINTIRGPMEEADLVKREGRIDNDFEHTYWVEYWLDGELVHRSAHVTLTEKAMAAAGMAGIAMF